MKWKRFLGTLCCHKAVFLRGVTSTLNSFYATKRQPLLFFNEKCGLVRVLSATLTLDYFRPVRDTPRIVSKPVPGRANVGGFVAAALLSRTWLLLHDRWPPWHRSMNTVAPRP